MARPSLKITTFAVVMLFCFAVQASNTNDCTFKEIYKIPIWQNDYVVWGTIFVISAGAAAFTTLTAGTGAPAAATGVSTIASALAGGGAGSYMAGLNMVGGLVGGNAIVGAAMLNAGSAALIGGTALKTIPTATLVTVETIRTIGPAILIPEEGKKQIDFIITLQPTAAIGSERVKKLVKRNEEIAELLQDKKLTRTEADEEIKEIAREAKNILELETGIHTDQSAKEKVSALLLLRHFNYIAEFSKYAKKLPERGSFILYLKSLAYLDEENYEKANYYAEMAMNAEEIAIEPILVRIAALNGQGKYQESIALENYIEKFDEDKYKTPFSKTTAYNMLGDYSSFRKNHRQAAAYYQKVFDDTGYFDPDEDKALISAKLANAYRLSGDSEKSNKYYQKALGYAEDSEKAADIKKGVENTFYSN